MTYNRAPRTRTAIRPRVALMAIVAFAFLLISGGALYASEAAADSHTQTFDEIEFTSEDMFWANGGGRNDGTLGDPETGELIEGSCSASFDVTNLGGTAKTVDVPLAMIERNAGSFPYTLRPGETIRVFILGESEGPNIDEWPINIVTADETRNIVVTVDGADFEIADSTVPGLYPNDGCARTAPAPECPIDSTPVTNDDGDLECERPIPCPEGETGAATERLTPDGAIIGTSSTCTPPPPVTVPVPVCPEGTTPAENATGECDRSVPCPPGETGEAFDRVDTDGNLIASTSTCEPIETRCPDGMAPVGDVCSTPTTAPVEDPPTITVATVPATTTTVAPAPAPAPVPAPVATVDDTLPRTGAGLWLAALAVALIFFGAIILIGRRIRLAGQPPR